MGGGPSQKKGDDREDNSLNHQSRVVGLSFLFMSPPLPSTLDLFRGFFILRFFFEGMQTVDVHRRPETRRDLELVLGVRVRERERE